MVMTWATLQHSRSRVSNSLYYLLFSVLAPALPAIFDPEEAAIPNAAICLIRSDMDY